MGQRLGLAATAIDDGRAGVQVRKIHVPWLDWRRSCAPRGFFEAYSGRDSILLHGTPEDVDFLLNTLSYFVAGADAELAIHSFAAVARSRPVQLYAVKDENKSTVPRRDLGNQFYWNCTKDWNATEGLLQSLITPPGGHDGAKYSGFHQYFEIDMPQTQLVVAVNEHDEDWWSRFG